jgi:hypothetical protein
MNTTKKTTETNEDEFNPILTKKISSVQGWFSKQFAEGIASRTFNPHNASASNIKYQKALLSSPITFERKRPSTRTPATRSTQEMKVHQNHLKKLKNDLIEKTEKVEKHENKLLQISKTMEKR